MEVNDQMSNTFKVPDSTSLLNLSSGKTEEVLNVKETIDISKNKVKSTVPLPYSEPEWSGTPPRDFSFEVIKNGTSVSIINVDASLTVFGRLDICDVVLEHPSVSRYHSIIQYCKGDDNHPKGFYLFDLGSTHGTFLNKEQIKSKIYYKLKPGYIIKFGGSTRLHIFQGPEEENDNIKPIIASKVDEEICDWGIGEDAEEEEDLSENPFALSALNEESYIDDPKKTLRGWFEREGYELDYEVEEKGFKTFVCRVKLPIDTPTGDFMTVEASVNGKKKEAVVACALEACRTLDRLGVLRQSHHESKQRKRKKWEENDYYDSDEDTYLDRTGTIEKKREIRKKIEKKDEFETYQSLETKLKAINDEISGIKNKLSTYIVNRANLSKNTDDDSLEMYMSSLKEKVSAPADKIEKTKLKFRLSEAEKEKNRLEILLNIAKPAKLPSLLKHPGMIGKKLKGKLNLKVGTLRKPVKHIEVASKNIDADEYESDTEIQAEQIALATKEETKQVSTENSEVMQISKKCEFIDHYESKSDVSVEVDEEFMSVDAVKNQNKEVEKEINSTKSNIVNKEKTDSKTSCTETSMKNKTVDSDIKLSKRIFGPEIPAKISECSKISINIERQTLKQEHLQYDSNCKRIRNKRGKSHNDVDVYETGSSDYSTWLPPPNQSGDGITHLNEKFGY